MISLLGWACEGRKSKAAEQKSQFSVPGEVCTRVSRGVEGVMRLPLLLGC